MRASVDEIMKNRVEKQKLAEESEMAKLKKSLEGVSQANSDLKMKNLNLLIETSDLKSKSEHTISTSEHQKIVGFFFALFSKFLKFYIFRSQNYTPKSKIWQNPKNRALNLSKPYSVSRNEMWNLETLFKNLCRNWIYSRDVSRFSVLTVRKPNFFRKKTVTFQR